MEVIITLPVPSTMFDEGVNFEELTKRVCHLNMLYEDMNGREKQIEITFESVESYKCTYLTSCNSWMIKNAYDKIVDCGETEWLKEISETYNRINDSPKALKHYMIYFDDGPCYEFICEKVELVES